MPSMPTACAALFDDESEHTAFHHPTKAEGGIPGGETGTFIERFGWKEGKEPMPPHDDGSAPHLPALAALGLDSIVDAHTHWFPENVMRKIWDYFDAHYWPITYRSDPAGRLEWVRRNGISRFTTLNYAHRPGMAPWLNQWTHEWARDVAEAIPCGTFYPEDGVAEYVRRAIEDYGFQGFKLHLRVSDMDPTLPVLTPAFQQLEEARLPVIIHSGPAPDPGRYTTPAYIRGLLSRHPGLVVVVAHMGAWDYEDYMALAEEYPGCYLDTTMVFVDYLACGAFPENQKTRLEALSDKILFGSDFPGIPYPLHHAVRGILDLPLSDEAKRKILAGNATRLFGLGDATPAPMVGP